LMHTMFEEEGPQVWARGEMVPGGWADAGERRRGRRERAESWRVLRYFIMGVLKNNLAFGVRGSIEISSTYTTRLSPLSKQSGEQKAVGE